MSESNKRVRRVSHNNTSVALTPELEHRLNETAWTRRVTRSELIRQALELLLPHYDQTGKAS
jgi:metal-responsive CopG/Arc/MetJ family transcriptional regulator